jgi:hypothetical protein
MESPYIADDVKHPLTGVFKNLRPFALRKELEDKPKKLFNACYKKSP